MKRFCILAILLFIARLTFAQRPAGTDTARTEAEHPYSKNVEQVPEFPGGVGEFYKYLGRNLKYPTIARLIGIGGKLNVSFVVDKDGRVTDATPKNCIGAGCEAEAVRLLESSPAWKPGIQNGKAVRVQYSVPITFTIDDKDGKVLMKELRTSGYGFVFSIKDTLYTIDEAEAILGVKFSSKQVQTAEPFYNYNKIAKFDMPDKKETYLIIIR